MGLSGLHFHSRQCMPIFIMLGVHGELAKLTEVLRKFRRHVTWVQGYSRSSNLAPVEQAYTTSY